MHTPHTSRNERSAHSVSVEAIAAVTGGEQTRVGRHGRRNGSISEIHDNDASVLDMAHVMRGATANITDEAGLTGSPKRTAQFWEMFRRDLSPRTALFAQKCADTANDRLAE